MAFDPRSLVPMIGGLQPGGGNAFLRGFMRAQQEIQQRQQQQQAMQRQSMLDERAAAREQRLDDNQQQQLMLQAEAARRAAEQQRLGYTQQLTRLFTDESVDPDVALSLATMAPPEGYDTGAIQSMHAKVFTPTERQRRAAVKRLGQIESDPQIKKLIEAGEDIAATFEVTELGGNPEDPQGRPLYTRSQLMRLAQKPVATLPLPKAQPDRRGYQRVEAMLDGKPAFVSYDPDTARYLDTAGQDVTARVTPTPPDRVVYPAPAAPAGQLPTATQRRVDAKTKAFDSQPVVKRIQTMAEAVTFAEGLDINTKNSADDQALIYAFAKAMDPDSVVREGEYATVQKYAQSWAERFGFDVARIFSNTTFLTPQARQNMKSTIRARYGAAKPQYENLRRSYAKQINQITQQGDGDTYLIDYAAGFPAAPSGGGVGGAAGATYQDYINSRPR